MNTNYSQRLENLNKLENMLPNVLDMLDTINCMPSSNQNEMNSKVHLIYSIVNVKDDLIDQIALAKIALDKKSKEMIFMKEQEGLARDVS